MAGNKEAFEAGHGGAGRDPRYADAEDVLNAGAQILDSGKKNSVTSVGRRGPRTPKAPKIGKATLNTERGKVVGERSTMPGRKLVNNADKGHRLLSTAASTLGSLRHPAMPGIMAMVQPKLDEAKELITSAGIDHDNNRGTEATPKIAKAHGLMSDAHDLLNTETVRGAAKEANVLHALPTQHLADVAEGVRTSTDVVKNSRVNRVANIAGKNINLDSTEAEAARKHAEEQGLTSSTPGVSKLTSRVRTPRGTQGGATPAIKAVRKRADNKKNIELSYGTDSNRIGTTPKFDATSAVKGGDAGMKGKK